MPFVLIRAVLLSQVLEFAGLRNNLCAVQSRRTISSSLQDNEGCRLLGLLYMCFTSHVAASWQTAQTEGRLGSLFLATPSQALTWRRRYRTMMRRSIE